MAKAETKNVLFGMSVAAATVAAVMASLLLVAATAAPSDPPSAPSPENIPVAAAAPDEAGPLLLAEVRLRIRVFLEGFLDGGSPPAPTSTGLPDPTIEIAEFRIGRSTTDESMETEGETTELLVTTNRPLTANERIMLRVTGADNGEAPVGRYRLSPQTIDGPTFGTRTMATFSRSDDRWHEPMQKAMVQAHVITKTSSPTFIASSRMVEIATEDDDPLTIRTSTPLHSIAPGESATLTLTFNTLLRTEIEVRGTGLETVTTIKPADEQTFKVALSVREDAPEGTMRVTVRAAVPETESEIEERIAMRIVTFPALRRTSIGLRIYELPQAEKTDKYRLTMTLNRALLSRERVIYEVIPGPGGLPEDYTMSPLLIQGPTSGPQAVLATVFTAVDDDQHEEKETFTVRATVNEVHYRGSPPQAVVIDKELLLQLLTITNDDALTIEASPPDEIPEGESRTVAVTLNTLLEASVRISGDTGIEPVTATKPAGVRTVDVLLTAVASLYGTQKAVTISAEVPATGARAETTTYVRITPPLPALQLTADRAVIHEGGSVALTLAVNRALEADESAGVQPTEGGRLLEAEPLVEGPAASTRVTTVFSAPDDILHGKPRTLLFRPILIHEVLLGAPPPGDEMDSDEMMEEMTMVGGVPLLWRWWQVNLFEGVEITITDDDPLVMEAPDSVTVADGESVTLTLAFNTDLEVEVTASSWAVRDVAVTKPAGVRTLAVALAVQPDVRSARPRIRFEARAAATGAMASAEVVLEVDRFVVLELSLSGGGTIEEGDSRELQLVLNRPLMPWEGVEFAVAGVEGVAHWPGAGELPGNREVTPAAIVGPTTTTRFSIIFSTSDNSWHEPDKTYAVWTGMDEETSSRNGQPFYDYYGYRSSTATSTAERKVVVTVEDNDPLVVGVTPQTVAAGEPTPAEVAFNTMRAVDVTGPDGTVTSLPGEVIWGGSHSFRKAMVLAREKTTAVRVQMRVAEQARSTADWWHEDRQVELKLDRAIIQTKRALDTAWLEAGLIEADDVRPMRRTELNPIRYARAIVPMSIREQWDAVLKIDFYYSEWYSYAAPLRIMDPDLPQDYTRPAASRAVLRGLEATLAGLDALIAESLDATKRTAGIELRVPAGADRAQVSVRVPATGAQAVAEVGVLARQSLTMQWSGGDAVIGEGTSQTLTLVTGRALQAGETVMIEVTGEDGPAPGNYGVSPQAIEGPTDGTQMAFVFSAPQDDLYEATTQVFLVQPTYRAHPGATPRRGAAARVTVIEDGDPLRLRSSLFTSPRSSRYWNTLYYLHTRDSLGRYVRRHVRMALNTSLEVQVSMPQTAALREFSVIKPAGDSAWEEFDLVAGLHRGVILPRTSEATIRFYMPATGDWRRWTFNVKTDGERRPLESAGAPTTPTSTFTPITARLSGDAVIGEGESHTLSLVLSRSLAAGESVRFEVTGEDGAPPGEYWLSLLSLRGPLDATQVDVAFSTRNDDLDLHEPPQRFLIRANVFSGAPSPSMVFSSDPVSITVESDDSLMIDAPDPFSVYLGGPVHLTLTLNTTLEAEVSVSGAGFGAAAATKPAGVRTVSLPLEHDGTSASQERITVRAQVPATGAEATAEITVLSLPPPPTMRLTGGDVVIAEGESQPLTLVADRRLLEDSETFTLEAAGGDSVSPGSYSVSPQAVKGPTTATQTAFVFSTPQDDLHEATTQVFLIRPEYGLHSRATPTRGVATRITVIDDGDPLTVQLPGCERWAGYHLTNSGCIGRCVTKGMEYRYPLTLNTALEVHLSMPRTGEIEEFSAIKPVGSTTVELVVKLRDDWAMPYRIYRLPPAQVNFYVPATGARATKTFYVMTDGGRGPLEAGGTPPERAAATLAPITAQLSGDAAVRAGGSHALSLTLSRSLAAGELVRFEVAGEDDATSSTHRLSLLSLRGPLDGTRFEPVFLAPGDDDDDLHELRKFLIHADVVRSHSPPSVVFSSGSVAITVEDDPLVVEAPQPVTVNEGETRTVSVTLNTLLAANVSVSGADFQPATAAKPAGTREVDVSLTAVAGQRSIQTVTISAEVPVTGARAEATMQVQIDPPLPALQLTADRAAIREGEAVELTLIVNRALEADESAGVQPTEGLRLLEAERLVEGPANPRRVTTVFSAPADGLHGKPRTLLFRPILIHEVLLGASMPGDEMDSDEMMEEMTMVGGVPLLWRWWQVNLFEGAEVTITDNDPLVMEAPDSVTIVDGESATVTLAFNTDLRVKVTATPWAGANTDFEAATVTKPAGVRTVEIELRVPAGGNDRVRVSARVPATGARAMAEISVLVPPPPPPTMQWSGDDAVIGEGESHFLALVTARPLLADETITFEVTGESGAAPRWNHVVSPQVIQGPTDGTQTMVEFSSLQNVEHEVTTQVSLIHPVYQSAQTTQRGTAARITVLDDDDRLRILTPQVFRVVYLEDLWAAFWGTLSYPDGSDTRQHRLMIYALTTLEVHVSMPQTAAIQEFSTIMPVGGNGIELVVRLRDGVILPSLSEVQVEFYVPTTGVRETRTFNVSTGGGSGPSESRGTPDTLDSPFTPITVQWSGDGAVIGEGGSHALPLTLSRSLTAGEAVHFAVTGEDGAASGAHRLSLRSLRGPLDGTQFKTVFLAGDGSDELYQAPERFLIRANVVRSSSPTSVLFSSAPIAVTVEYDGSLTIDAPDPFAAYLGGPVLLPLTLNTESEVEVSASGGGFYPVTVTKPAGTRTLNLPLEHDGTSAWQEGITIRVRVPGTNVEATAEITVLSLPPPPTMRLMGGDRVIGEGGAQVLTLVTGRLLQTSETVALEVAGEDGAPPGNYDLSPQGIEGPATDTQAAFVFSAPQDDLHEATTQVFLIQPTYEVPHSRTTPTRGVATRITVLDDGDPLTAHLPGCDRSYGYHLTKSGCIGKCVTQGVEYRYPLILNTALEVHVSMPRTREIEEFSVIKPAGTRTVDLVVKLRDDWTMPFWIHRLPPAQVKFHVPATGASATKAFYVMTDGGRGPLEAGGTPPERAAATLTPITAQLSGDAVIREGGSHTLSLALSRPLATGESVRFEVTGEHGAVPGAHRLSLLSLRGPLDGTQFKTIFLAPTADDDDLHDETPQKFLIQADVVRNHPPPIVAFSSGSVAITIEDDPLVIKAIEAPTRVSIGELVPVTVSLNTRLWTEVTIRGSGLETVTMTKPAGPRTVRVVLSVSADAEPGMTRMTVSAFVPATEARAEGELTIEVSRATTLTLTPVSLSAETFVSEGERSELPLTLSRALRSSEWITFEVIGGAGATSSDYDLSPQIIEGPTIGPQATVVGETPDPLRVTPVFSALDDGRHEASETFAVRAQAHVVTQRASTPTGVVFDTASANLPPAAGPGASTPTSVMPGATVLFDEEVARFTVTDNDALTIEAPQLIEIAEGESRVITVTLNTMLAASVSVSEDGVHPVGAAKLAGGRTVDVLLTAVTGQYGTQSATVSAEVPATGARAEATMRVRIIPPRPALQLTADRTAIREGESVELTLAVNRALEADESAGMQPTENGQLLEADRLIEGPANPGRVTTTFSAPADGLHGKPRTLLFRPILVHEVLLGAAMPGDEMDPAEMMEETTMVSTELRVLRWWQANLFEGVEITVTDDDPLVMEASSSVTVEDGESATVTLTFNTDLEVEVTATSWAIRSTGTATIKPAGVRTLEVPLEVPFGTWPGRPRVQFAAQVTATGATASAEVTLSIERRTPSRVSSFSGTAALEEGDSREFQLRLTRPLTRWESVRFYITDADATGNPRDMPEKLGNRKLTPTTIDGPTPTQISVVFSTSDNSWHEPDSAYAIWARIDRNYYWDPFFFYHYHPDDDTSSSIAAAERKMVVTVEDNDPLTVSVTPPTVVAGEPTTVEVAVNTLWRTNVAGPGAAVALDNEVGWGQSAAFRDAMVPAREKIVAARVQLGARRTQEGTRWFYDMEALLRGAIRDVKWALDTAWAEAGLIRADEVRRRTESYPAIRHARDIVPASVRRKWDAVLKIKFTYDWRRAFPAQLRIMDPDLPAGNREWDSVRALLLGVEETIAGLDALIAESRDMTVRTIEMELLAPEEAAPRTTIRAWTQATGGQAETPLDVRGADLSAPSMPLLTLSAAAAEIREGESVGVTLALSRALRAGEAVGMTISENGEQREVRRLLSGPASTTQVATIFSSPDDDLHESVQTILLRPVVILEGTDAVESGGGAVRIMVEDNDPLVITVPDPLEIPVGGRKTFPVTLNTDLEASIHIEKTPPEGVYNRDFRFSEGRATKPRGERSVDVTLSTRRYWNGQFRGRIEVRVPGTNTLAERTFGVHITGRSRITVRMKKSGTHHVTGPTEVTVALSRPLKADEYVILQASSWYINPYYGRGPAATVGRGSYQFSGPTDGTEVKFWLRPATLYDYKYSIRLNPRVHVRRAQNQHVSSSGGMSLVFDDVIPLRVEVPRSVEIRSGGTKSVRISVNTRIWTMINVSGPGVQPLRFGLARGGSRNFQLRARNGARGTSRVTVRATAVQAVQREREAASAQSTFNLRVTR